MSGVPLREYTPGPWSYVPDYDENDGDIIIGNSDESPRVVSICFKSDLQDDEQYPVLEVRANARLIAAAPDLFEALAAVDDYILQEAEYAPNTFHAALRDAAQAAIARVRGLCEASK